jgi:Protein of unknown function (DUF3015)
MKKALWALAAVALFAGGAWAGSQNDAGCGLGSQIFTDNTPVHQILAATTNATIGSQTFGITTGTLGCTSGGLIKTAQERNVFTETNFRAIAQETAAGKGQYLTSLAALSGCRAGAFSAFAKARYGTLFPSAATTPAQFLDNLDRAIVADPAMTKACGVGRLAS